MLGEDLNVVKTIVEVQREQPVACSEKWRQFLEAAELELQWLDVEVEEPHVDDEVVFSVFLQHYPNGGEEGLFVGQELVEGLLLQKMADLALDKLLLVG